MSIPELARNILDLPPEASSVAGAIDGLHLLVISVTMLSATIVALVALWFIVRYPRRTDEQLTPYVHATPLAEVLTVGGTLALFLVFWVIGYLQYVDLREPPEGAATVYVTAKQWMWKFSYPAGQRANDVLTVPVGEPVKLVMTSRDVIHSFYVPAFRIKQDVLPGRYVTTWFLPTRTGRFPILCAEYCGLSHSYMRGEVLVLSRAEYAARLADTDVRGTSEPSLADVGAAVAERRACLSCHTLNGQPFVGPTFARLYGSTAVLADGRRVVVDEAYLTRSMMEPLAEVVAGYKPVMPTYLGRLDEAETASLVELIKALKDGGIPSGVRLPQLQVEQAPGAPGAEEGR